MSPGVKKARNRRSDHKKKPEAEGEKRETAEGVVLLPEPEKQEHELEKIKRDRKVHEDRMDLHDLNGSRR